MRAKLRFEASVEVELESYVEIDAWLERWKANRIGFHEGQPNAHLVAHVHRLGMPLGGRVFVPLCGKSVDIHWLLGNGFQVAGAELSELAIEQLFAELEVVPTIEIIGELKRYSAANIDIYVGNIFDLTGDLLGHVDAVFDRAALVALPEELRGRYVAHVAEITGCAAQLLVTFEYDQSLMSGPPFSISEAEVEQHYAPRYSVSEVGEAQTATSIRSISATERVWLMMPKQQTSSGDRGAS